jgi:hypothetical protein
VLLQHEVGSLTEQEELSCGKGIVVGISSAASSFGEKRHILQPELILTASPPRSVHKLRECPALVELSSACDPKPRSNTKNR